MVPFPNIPSSHSHAGDVHRNCHLPASALALCILQACLKAQRCSSPELAEEDSVATARGAAGGCGAASALQQSVTAGLGLGGLGPSEQHSMASLAASCSQWSLGVGSAAAAGAGVAGQVPRRVISDSRRQQLERQVRRQCLALSLDIFLLLLQLIICLSKSAVGCEGIVADCGQVAVLRAHSSYLVA